MCTSIAGAPRQSNFAKLMDRRGLASAQDAANPCCSNIVITTPQFLEFHDWKWQSPICASQEWHTKYIQTLLAKKKHTFDTILHGIFALVGFFNVTSSTLKLPSMNVWGITFTFTANPLLTEIWLHGRRFHREPGDVPLQQASARMDMVVNTKILR